VIRRPYQAKGMAMTVAITRLEYSAAEPRAAAQTQDTRAARRMLAIALVLETWSREACLFGAICPERCTGTTIIMPEVNVAAMNEHQAEISRRGSVGAIALLVLDGAG
jgi:hypothetical protein